MAGANFGFRSYERVFQFLFHSGEQDFFLGKKKEMILEVYVDKHGLIRIRIVGHVDVGRLQV